MNIRGIELVPEIASRRTAAPVEKDPGSAVRGAVAKLKQITQLWSVRFMATFIFVYVGTEFAIR